MIGITFLVLFHGEKIKIIKVFILCTFLPNGPSIKSTKWAR